MYLLYYLIGCAVLGAIGMTIANAKADAQTRRQRWLKYFVYIFLTFILITAIYQDFFWIAAVLILLAGIYEIITVLKRSGEKRVWFKIKSLLVYAILATGFLIFSFQSGKYFQLVVYLQVLMFDAFSQVTGQLFGSKKLAPSISPGKTVGGLIGGFAFCMITTLAVWNLLEVTVLGKILSGLFTAASALAGDLLASWFKRKMKIKDYSRLLPGQGGVLDRYDSLIGAGFFYGLLILIQYLTWMNHVDHIP